MKAIEEDEVADRITLGFRTKTFDNDGVLYSDVAVYSELNNVDVCKTDVDTLDANTFGAVVEGEPINGT